MNARENEPLLVQFRDDVDVSEELRTPRRLSRHLPEAVRDLLRIVTGRRRVVTATADLNDEDRPESRPFGWHIQQVMAEEHGCVLTAEEAADFARRLLRLAELGALAVVTPTEDPE